MEQELEERDNLPLESQSWFAGDLPVKTATDRLEALPVGTFLVRHRANGCYALMLKSPELPRGVKSMKIETRFRYYNLQLSRSCDLVYSFLHKIVMSFMNYVFYLTDLFET
jgi:hypothetical protein